MAFVPSDDSVLQVTVDEYRALERRAPEPQESLDGWVYAIPGESLNHGTICMNLCGTVAPVTRNAVSRFYSRHEGALWATTRTDRSRQGLPAYPDFMVVCGATQFHDQAQDVLLNPKVIIEVLSPSTEAFDRDDKFRRYRA